MKHRLLRLALGAAVAAAVAAPAAPANAWYCNPRLHAVCDAIVLACQVVDDNTDLVACAFG
jgi:hypothetical protein